MGDDKILQELLREAPSVIRRSKARLLRRGLGEHDIEDLEQDLYLLLLRRATTFNPSRASPAAFVQFFLGKVIATRIEKMTAQRRGGAHKTLSLDLKVTDHGLRLLDQLAASDAGRVDLEFLDLVASMPEELREVAVELAAGHSIVEVARRLGVHRDTVYARIGRIRKLGIFEDSR